MSLGPADIGVRATNLQVGESQAERAQRMKLAEMQQRLAEQQMQQQGTQFGLSLDQQARLAAAQMGANEYQFNETRDATDRNAIGQGISGAIAGLGGIVGAGVAPGGFMLPKKSTGLGVANGGGGYGTPDPSEGLVYGLGWGKTK